MIVLQKWRPTEWPRTGSGSECTVFKDKETRVWDQSVSFQDLIWVFHTPAVTEHCIFLPQLCYEGWPRSESSQRDFSRCNALLRVVSPCCSFPGPPQSGQSETVRTFTSILQENSVKQREEFQNNLGKEYLTTNQQVFLEKVCGKQERRTSAAHNIDFQQVEKCSSPISLQHGSSQKMT